MKVSALTRRQLPKIALPKFSGDFTVWLTYRDLFASMVGGNASLNAIEKLHYLKMSLLKEPTALLASVPLTAESLASAWKISNIVTLPSMKTESSSELRELLNGTVNAVSALRALGRQVDGYDDFLVYHTVHKLDTQSRHEWESSLQISSTKTPPRFTEFQTFLES